MSSRKPLVIVEETLSFCVFTLLTVCNALRLCKNFFISDSLLLNTQAAPCAQEFKATLELAQAKLLHLTATPSELKVFRKCIKYLRHENDQAWVPLSHLSHFGSSHFILRCAVTAVRKALAKGDKVRFGIREEGDKYALRIWQGNSKGYDFTQPIPDEIRYGFHGTSYIAAYLIMTNGFDSSQSKKGARALNCVAAPECLGRKGAKVYVVFDIAAMKRDGVPVGLSADGETIIGPSKVDPKYIIGLIPIQNLP